MAFEELKQKQAVIWGSAPYERVSDHLGIAHEHLLARLAPGPGQRWLDVATGTGELARPAARAGADVTGLDLAPGLIETARRRAEEEGLAIRFDVGDAERLPYPDASFDIVCSSFGCMFAPDHAAVAGELARVCRPGGRLALACWRPNVGVHDVFKLMAPFQPPAPAGIGNPFDWGSEEHVTALLGDAFDLEFEDGDCPQTAESAESVWELFSTSYGPTKALVASLEPERREALRQAFVGLYEQWTTHIGVHQPRPYQLALGTRRAT